MATGDKFTGFSSVADTSYLDIQPSSGDEAVIHNIYVDGSVEVYVSDDTNEIKIGDYTDSLLYFAFHVTNSQFLRVKNTSGGSLYIAYDGVKTKE